MYRTDQDGGRIGRATRVDAEIAGSRGGNRAAPRAPGRQTLVSAEARKQGLDNPSSPVAAPPVEASDSTSEPDALASAETTVAAVVPAEDSPPSAPSVAGGAPARPHKEVADVVAGKPEVGLAQLRGARPDRISLLFGEVHTAARRDAAQARAKLQASPPRQMSSGMAAGTKDGARGADAEHKADTKVGSDPKASADSKTAVDPEASADPTASAGPRRSADSKTAADPKAGAVPSTAGVGSKPGGGSKHADDPKTRAAPPTARADLKAGSGSKTGADPRMGAAPGTGPKPTAAPNAVAGAHPTVAPELAGPTEAGPTAAGDARALTAGAASGAANAPDAAKVAHGMPVHLPAPGLAKQPQQPGRRANRGDAAPAEADADRRDAGAPGGGKISEAETRQMAGSLDQLPTTVQGIPNHTGPADALAVSGDAKASTDQGRSRLDAKVAGLETQGRADSAAPMGEGHIETTVAPEELTAAPPRSTPHAGPPLPTLASAGASEEVGLVAKEQHGAEIDAALAKASTDATAERAKHAQAEAEARVESDRQIRELKTKAEADQAAARAAAQAEVQKARGEWQAEIDKKGADARKQADQKIAGGMAQVRAEEAKANAAAKQHLDEGKQKADEENQKGEQAAAEAKEQGKQRSSGFFGWLASKAKAAFDGIKQAVSAAIDAARQAVKAVLDAAKQLAMAAIELGRKLITAALTALGEALIAISNVVLAAFPELKARFQAAIRTAIDAAIGAVNKIADGLKTAVQKALDVLGAALDRALQLLEQGLSAIVDAAGAVVQGAIKAAQVVVEALGTWAKLIKDVVTNPGDWLGKLGAAIVDGIKHHLWTAFKTAVIAWFKSKVFELLGIGGIILELLLEGGLTRDHIIQMALDALIVAIPAALVAILIEKLVSMIVPAAGAVLAVIQGLQAAWGTISRIIAAFGAFMAFLLAVKGGTAGPLFAAVLASAAVVVLDFVSNWLLKKIASAAKKVGARLKGMAEKFQAKRKARGQGGAKAAGKPGEPHHAPSQGDAHAPTKPDRRADGNKHGDGDKPGKDKPGKDKPGKDKPGKDKDKKTEADKATQKQQLAQAASAIRPKLAALIARQPSNSEVRSQLAAWKVQHHLTDLRMDDHGGEVTFTAKVNPEEKVGKAIHPLGMALFKAKQRAQEIVKKEVEARSASDDLAAEFRAQKKKGQPLELPTAEDQVRFAGVLQSGTLNGRSKSEPKPFTGDVLIGHGDSKQDTTSFTQLRGNAIFVRGLGTSQQLLQDLRDGARRLGLTERQLAQHILHFSKTGEIDPKIEKDKKLMSVIRNEVFRQNAVEPARIPTHLADRSGALTTATGRGGTISDLETPADIAPIKKQQQGAVKGHATAQEMIRRQEAGEDQLRAGTIRERTGRLVLHASEEEAEKLKHTLGSTLLHDSTALTNMLADRIRRVILGRTS